MSLIFVKEGESPSSGRLGRVERLHHTMANEVGESLQGDEEKSGFVGTISGQPGLGLWIAQTCNANPHRVRPG